MNRISRKLAAFPIIADPPPPPALWNSLEGCGMSIFIPVAFVICCSHWAICSSSCGPVPMMPRACCSSSGIPIASAPTTAPTTSSPTSAATHLRLMGSRRCSAFRITARMAAA